MHISSHLLLVSAVAIGTALATQATASTTSGIDTPNGVTTLPLAVQGVPGCILLGGTDAHGQPTVPDLGCAGLLGLGTTSPKYLLDAQNLSATSQIHFSGTGNDDGGYLLGYSANDAVFSAGAAYNGTNWVAKSTSASLIQPAAGNIYFYGDTGLTVGNTYTPTERMVINPGGVVGGATQPQAVLEVKGEARVGSTGTGCGSSNAGSIRYDNSTTPGQFVGCNGVNWTSLSAQQGSNIVSFMTPGTYSWTVPSGVTKIDVEVWGGGGGGSGGIGGSGGGGGYATGDYSVTPGNIYSVVVGVGGAAAQYPNVGGTGGISGIVGVIGAFGGAGGSGGGGQGGQGVNGQFNLVGGDGMDLGDVAGGADVGNATYGTFAGVAGGASPRGGPGGGFLGSGAPGNDGKQPGGGGGATYYGGGNGAPGAVLIKY